MSFKLIVSCLFILPGFLFGQTRLITEDEIAYSKIRPETLRQLQWLPETEGYSYVDPVKNNLVISHVKNPDQTVTITLPDLNSLFKPIGLPELKSFPAIKWISKTEFWTLTDKKLVIADLQAKKAISVADIPDETGKIEISEDLKIAYTVNNALFFVTPKSSHTLIAKAESTDIKFGQDVHQREFGIEKGLFWSPGGKLLAFYRSDDANVTKYPFVDFTTRPAQSVPAMYPMAGMSNQIVTIGVFNPETGQTVYLKTGDPADQYLTNITWSPDSKYIYVAHVNRDQNQMKLNRYQAETGELDRILFEERDSCWVEPTTGPVFVPGNSGEFLWLSNRDGWKHIYYYNRDGNLIKQVTSGNWEVTKIEGFDSDQRICFTATKTSPMEKQIFRSDLKLGKIEKLTEGKGTHQVIFSPTGKYFLDIFNSLTVPNSIRLEETGKKRLKTILDSADPLAGIETGETQVFTFSGQDSTQLYGRLIFPRNMIPEKKYPVILYVYGGPHSQQVTDSWPTGSYSLWSHYMASKGFIVLTVDNRGTSSRGRDFEQKTYRKLGTLEMEDQIAGLNYLFKTFPNADRSRVGVFGWSYGGFMTTSLMTRMPSFFKAGVAGAPVIDWKYYETVYTERYMDSPEQNPAGFSSANVINYVSNLKGKLLIIQGTSDPVVMWQHSLLFVKEAASTNTPLDYFVYPGHLHGISGKDRLHLWSKINRYFLENL
ncbi:MAG: S9 family peptidase [Bacteroidetes bacterium]|nr:S9 family peptidase [Bacteroidota bacterium]